MRRRHLPPAHSNHPNVTPLIDVVMCLIIFFMLVAKIGVNTGADPSITVPATILGKELADPGQALTLNVRAGIGEQPMVTALVESGTNQPQEIKIIDTVTNTRPLLEVLKKIKVNKPDLKIIIRGDKEMGYKFLEPVLITCLEAKVTNVNFNTSKAIEAVQEAMKIKGAKAIHYDAGPNMTPLVDVVMVILIFLMLAGSFAGAEHYLVSNLPYTPKGAGGQPPPPGFVPDEPLEIKVDSPVYDRFVARVGPTQVEDAEQLRALLIQRRDQLETTGTQRDKVQVVISPGRNVKYKFLIDVYQAAMQAQFPKIGFAPAR